MEQTTSTTLKPLQLAGLAGLATLTSGVVAITVLYTVRRRQHASRAAGMWLEVEKIPTRPASDAPGHFSEDAIVPGFTKTGAEVLREDNVSGRSPEGV